jgi:hypothetical protein
MVNDTIEYPKLLPCYGKWMIHDNGVIKFSTNGLNIFHPHKKLSEMFVNVKNVKNIKMHKFPVFHTDDGDYRIDSETIKHGNLSGLSDEIQRAIEPTLKYNSHHTDQGGLRQEVTSNLTGIKAKIIISNNVEFIVLTDVNDHPVAATVRSEKSISGKHLAQYMAQYLAHEHHRASIAIHGDHLLCHAPDHIPAFQSPLEYWPNNSTGTFFRTVPNLLKNKS